MVGLFPRFISPFESMRALSLPPVFNIKLEEPFTPALAPVISIPLLAVTIPTESILVTSSYVRVPPTDTLLVNEPVSYTHLTLPTIYSV